MNAPYDKTVTSYEHGKSGLDALWYSSLFLAARYWKQFVDILLVVINSIEKTEKKQIICSIIWHFYA